MCEQVRKGKTTAQSVTWEDKTVLIPVRHEKASDTLAHKFPKGRDRLSHSSDKWVD